MKAFERAFLVLLVAFALWHVEVGYAETPTCDTTLPLDSIGANFHHTSWTSKDGAPAGIVTIAQTPSGWLWVGSNAGLFRFDGVHFERVDLRPPQSTASHSVVRLYVNRGGDLWVAYSFGGADQLAGDTGHITHTREDAEGGTTHYDFAQSAGGDTWAATTKQNIYRLENGNWVTPTAEWGLQGRHVAHITADSQGRLWASSDLGLYVLPVGGRKFVRADQSPADDFGIFEEPAGAIDSCQQKIRLSRIRSTYVDAFSGRPAPLFAYVKCSRQRSRRQYLVPCLHSWGVPNVQPGFAHGRDNGRGQPRHVYAG